MAVSGSNVWNPDFVEAIEEAYERVGLDGPRTGYEMRTARRSIDIMFADWANRGFNLWTITENSQVLTYADGSYTIPADTVDVVEVMLQIPQTGSQVVRYNVDRVSISTHATRTNPDLLGRPTEIYVDRQQAAPVIHLWPLPDSSGPYTLYFWTLRRVDDAGAYTNTADVPFRFLPAFISGLAYHVSEKKRTDDPNLILRLQQRYEADWLRASEEDRDRSTLNIVPRGSSYRVN